MTRDHVARRIGLAEWHASEAILREAAGDFEQSEGHVQDACEYLRALKGAPVNAETPAEVIAMCCELRETVHADA